MAVGITELGPDADGSEVTLPVGGRLRLVLPETPTTGYRWEVAVPSGVRLLDDEVAVPVQPAGAPGVRSVLLEVVAPGDHRVAAAKRRRWGGGEPVARCTVLVRAVAASPG